jgi:hypothetical protein
VATLVFVLFGEVCDNFSVNSTRFCAFSDKTKNTQALLSSEIDVVRLPILHGKALFGINQKSLGGIQR